MNGVGEHEKFGVRATLALQAFEHQVVFVIKHRFEALPRYNDDEEPPQIAAE